jgi:drug/metabolite transporter (DMT)-like permease
LTADLLLLITAIIWGFAFVAQRIGMNHMGPFTFNAIRFSLGALSLVPFLIIGRKRRGVNHQSLKKRDIVPILLTGLALFGGASLQQIGLVGTSAGKAGFITSLYVILVPVIALLWGERTQLAHWVGAVLAVFGLYLLSIRGGFTISPYDLVVLLGAFVWAVHVHLIARVVKRVGAIRLAVIQFAICGLLSGAAALIFEDISLPGIIGGGWAILYGSFLSVGLAYTLQVVAQRRANPTHAVILLSLEGVFAALGGWLVLGEGFTLRGVIGCVLILLGTLVSQFFATPHPNQIEGKSEGEIIP